MLHDEEHSGERTKDVFVSGCMRMTGFAKSKDLLAEQIAVESLNKWLSLLSDHLDDGNLSAGLCCPCWFPIPEG